ncbi:hypothetical protein K466DRAFT_139679 [Polyporus arcularius HHB13444]|uniref:Uncharacterized protein n=1 Tax=Polyporus arcularius HHB13444 TaxID=1314778 RepID=A0A5C3PDV8_9APHY|nr:hypothetical protein K466DRAFT_139679 [Polyporus arcularius HHB13444]
MCPSWTIAACYSMRLTIQCNLVRLVAGQATHAGRRTDTFQDRRQLLGGRLALDRSQPARFARTNIMASCDWPRLPAHPSCSWCLCLEGLKQHGARLLWRSCRLNAYPDPRSVGDRRHSAGAPVTQNPTSSLPLLHLHFAYTSREIPTSGRGPVPERCISIAAVPPTSMYKGTIHRSQAEPATSHFPNAPLLHCPSPATSVSV